MGARNNLRNITYVCCLCIMLNPHQYKQKTSYYSYYRRGINVLVLRTCVYVSSYLLDMSFLRWTNYLIGSPIHISHPGHVESLQCIGVPFEM